MQRTDHGTTSCRSERDGELPRTRRSRSADVTGASLVSTSTWTGVGSALLTVPGTGLGEEGVEQAELWVLPGQPANPPVVGTGGSDDDATRVELAPEVSIEQVRYRGSLPAG